MVNRPFPITGIILFAVLTQALEASAQTEPLFQRLSVPFAENTTLRGQNPPPVLNFQSCTHPPPSPQPQSNLFERTGRYIGGRLGSDFRNFYSCDTAMNYGVALAGGAILANTAMDRHVAEWYQRDVRSTGTDDFAKFSKQFGEWTIWVPVFAVTAISYRFYELSDWNKRNERNPFGEYATRTTRGYLVGFPSVIVFQSLLGAERPNGGNEKGSYWRPFHEDHGVSGHSFVGAMPFITAAQMTDKPWLKGVFYACSVLPAWSRVNDDAHYLSQAILGWYLAYLSARAVSQTEGVKLPKGLTIFPITEGRYVGVGFLYKR